jgi:hypothetical protein
LLKHHVALYKNCRATVPIQLCLLEKIEFHLEFLISNVVKRR